MRGWSAYGLQPGVVRGQAGFGLRGRFVRIAQSGVLADSTGTIGTLLVRDYLLAFQAIGVVLTAALIGALALLRDRRAA